MIAGARSAAALSRTAGPEQRGNGMASRGWDGDGSQHDAVMSNLMDLQARLRGDPASLVLPRDGRRERPRMPPPYDRATSA